MKVTQLYPTLRGPLDCSLPGSPVHGILQARILEWMAIAFSRGYSQARNQTQVSHIVGGFFTISATREAQEYWSGKPIPSPGHLPNSGVTPGSPARQAHSLQAELLGKPLGDKLTQPVELCSKFETFYKGKNFFPVSSLYESLGY